MVLLNCQQYGDKFHLSKFNYENVEAAIDRLSQLFETEIYSSNKYWIQDEEGNTILSSRKTKAQAAKQYHKTLNT